MSKTLLVIPVLLVLLVVPTTAFSQTDDIVVTEELNPAYFEYLNSIQEIETVILPEVDSFQPWVVDTTSDSVVSNMMFEQFAEDITLPVSIEVIEDSEMIQVTTTLGKVVYQKDSGAGTFFDESGVVIKSDSYVVRGAEINTDVWFNLDVNNQIPDVSVEFDEYVAVVKVVRENDEGKFIVENIVDDNGIKTTAYFTNGSYIDHKFAFTETLELPDNLVKLNDQDIDLSIYSGQSFSREVLEQNEDLFIQAKEVYFSAGLGFQYLWQVNVHEVTSEGYYPVSLDWANVDEVALPIGRTIDLDPTTAWTYGSWLGNTTNSQKWANPAIDANGNLVVQGDKNDKFWVFDKSNGTLLQTINWVAYPYGTGQGFEIHPVTGNWWVYGNNTMEEIEVSGSSGSYSLNQINTWNWQGSSMFAGGVCGNARDLAFSPVDGNGWLACYNTGNGGAVEFDETNGNYIGKVLPDYWSKYTGITVDGNNGVYLSSQYGASWFIDQSNGTWTSFTDTVNSGSGNENDFDYDTVKDVVIIQGQYGNGEIKIYPAMSNSNGSLNAMQSALYTETGHSYYKTGVVMHDGTSYHAGGYNSPTPIVALTWAFPPATPSAPVATTSGGTNTVTWTADPAVTQYKVFRNGANLVATLGAVGTYADSSVTGGTAYTYQLEATNSAGTSAFSPASNSVTPITAPSNVSNLSVSQSSPNQVNLSWSAPSNGGSAITKYDLYPSTGSVAYNISGSATSYTWNAPTSSQGSSVNFFLVSTNAIGSSGNSNNPSLTMWTIPSTPSAPSVSTSGGTNSVSWSAPSNGGTGITNYQLYRNGSLYQTLGNTLSYSDSSVTLGTSYYYSIKSGNSVGYGSISGNSSTVIPSTVPTAPSAPVATMSGGTNTVTWTAPNSNGSAITGYELWRGGSLYQTLGNVTTYNDTSVTLGTSYNYAIKAINGIGNSAISTNSNSVIPALVPTAPSAPVATFVSNTSNTVTWSAPANNGSAITNYELFRNGSTLGNVGNVLTYTDTGLAVGSSNLYSLKAINGIGSSLISSNSNTILNANPPDAPTNLATVSGIPITMTWTAPSSDVSITGYKIYRDGALIQTLGVAGSFSDNTASAGTTYSYEVSAVSSAGEGSKSNSSTAVGGLPADPPSLGLTHNSANLNINVAITDGNSMGTGTLTNYTVERSADGSTGWTSVGTPNTSPFVDTVPNAGTWYYRANTITNHGTSGYSSVVNIAHVDPDAPSITSASYSNPANSNIEVVITNGSSFGTGDFASYTIERSADGTTNWTSAGTATSSPFTDTNVPSVGDWYYRVATNTPHGISAFSSNGLASPVAPDTPTGITSTISNPNPSPLTVSVGWTAPSNFGSGNLTGYEVYRDGILITTTGTSTGHTDTVPNAGTFVYTVKTVTTHSTSVLSGSTSITTPTVPVSDSSVSLSIDNPNPNPLDITVSFIAPSGNGGSTVVSYDLHSSSDNITFNQIATGVTADQTITVASSGTWYFKSLTTNNVGSSLLGNAVSITTPTLPTGDASVTLAIPDPDGFPFNSTATFVAPSFNGGSAITGYNLFYSDDNVTYSQIATASNSVINQTLTGAGTHYFKVESINNVGTSAPSSAITIDTPTVPVSDSSITLSIDNPNPNPLDITVSFVAPSNDGGSAVLTYDLHSSSDNVTFNQISTGVTADQTVTVSSAGTWYFKSLSTNNVGSSTLGTAVSITTPSVPTGDASVTLAIPDPDNFPFNSTATFVAPSNDGGSAVTGYNLYYSDDDITYSQIATASNSVISQTLTGAGTHYFKVESINNVGTSAPSSAITIDTPTVPSADASATLAINNPNPSPLTITATFVAPSNDGGSAVIDYNLLISNDNVTYTQIATGVNGTYDTTVSQSGTYYFKVESTNLIGTTGVGSATSIATPTVPTAPQNAGSTIADIDNAPYDVTVTWETPSSTGGSDLTQYNVYRKQGSSAYSLLTTTTGLSITDTVPTSLSTNFTYKIHSVNNVGESTAFDDTTITTFNLPSAPTLSVTTGTTVLSWNTPVSDATVSSYKIYRDNVLITTVGAVTTYSDFSTIVFGNSYDFKIVAVSSLGDSADSNTVTTTPETEITGMVARGVTGTGAVIDWDEPAYYQGQVTSYNVYYGNSGTPATNAGTTTNTFSNFAPQLDYDTTYVFGVSINSPLGNSGLSNIVAITTNIDTSIVSADPTTGGVGWFDIDSVNNQSVNVIEFQRETQMISGNLTDTLQVAYPTWWDEMTCDVDYKFAQKTEQYVEGDDMTAQVNSANADQQVIGFQFQEIDNEVIEVQCAPQQSTQDDGVSAKYVMTQNSLGAVGEVGTPNIPIVAQITNFSNGTYGTDGDFGALNIVGLFAILISMVGFNRLNPIVGVLLSASMIFVLSWFGIITIPTAIIGAIALVIFLSWGATRSR